MSVMIIKLTKVEEVALNLLAVIILVFAILLLLVGCTSKPYVVKSVEKDGVVTDTVCTHKRAVVPWFVGVAGGFVSFKYGRECKEVVNGADKSL